MYITQSEHCCGLGEIGNFLYDYGGMDLNQIKKLLLEYIENYWIEDLENKNNCTNLFIATTLEKSQAKTGKILEEIGFKRTKLFYGKYGKEERIILWTLSEKNFSKELKEIKKKLEKERKEDESW